MIGMTPAEFSFSGMKTALSKLVREAETKGLLNESYLADAAASFQRAIVRQLAETTANAACDLPVKKLIVAGGVACNHALRGEMEKVASKLSIPVYFPSKHLSTDNAAMIAAAAYPKLVRGETSGLSMTADITLRMQNVDNIDNSMKGKVRYRL